MLVSRSTFVSNRIQQHQYLSIRSYRTHGNKRETTILFCSTHVTKAPVKFIHIFLAHFAYFIYLSVVMYRALNRRNEHSTYSCPITVLHSPMRFPSPHNTPVLGLAIQYTTTHALVPRLSYTHTQYVRHLCAKYTVKGGVGCPGLYLNLSCLFSVN